MLDLINSKTKTLLKYFPGLRSMTFHICRLIAQIKPYKNATNSYLIKIILFNFKVCFPWVGWFDFQAFFSLARIFLTFICFRSLLITLFHIFLGCSLGKLPLTLKALHSLDQAFSLPLSRPPNHCSLLSCKHYPVLSNFILVLCFSAEMLSSGLTLRINVTTPASFL